MTCISHVYRCVKSVYHTIVKKWVYYSRIHYSTVHKNTTSHTVRLLQMQQEIIFCRIHIIMTDIWCSIQTHCCSIQTHTSCSKTAVSETEACHSQTELCDRGRLTRKVQYIVWTTAPFTPCATSEVDRLLFGWLAIRGTFDEIRAAANPIDFSETSGLITNAVEPLTNPGCLANGSRARPTHNICNQIQVR